MNTNSSISGLCAAIQLQRKLQLATYTMFELEADIGGTWFSNTNPGCQIDTAAHLYAYSFDPNYEWSKWFIPQSEVLSYLRAVTRTYNIYDKIWFQTRVTTVQWHEGRAKWILHWINASTGQQGDYEADIVIHAAGVLRVSNIPKEFEEFKGSKWHSARWNISVDLRVGIVGSSASAVQIVPAIADKVRSLDIYGRSPAYMTPQLNVTYTGVWRFLFRNKELRQKLTPVYELVAR